MCAPPAISVATALSKSALIDSQFTDLSDTAEGLVRFITFRQLLLGYIMDTLTVVNNATAFDTVSGNETVLIRSGIHYQGAQDAARASWSGYRLFDHDRDGQFDSLQTLQASRGFSHTRIVHTSGVFTSQNARPYIITDRQLVVFGSADTLEVHRFEDHDGDGVVFDPGAEENIVRYVKMRNNPALEPLVVRRTVTTLGHIRRNSLRNLAVIGRERSSTLSDGTLRRQRVFTPDSTALLADADTVVLIEQVTNRTQRITKRTIVSMEHGPAVIRLSAEGENYAADIRSFSLNLTFNTSTQVPAQTPGTLHFTVMLTDRREIAGVASLAEELITIEFTDQGRVRTLDIDRE